MRIRNIDTLTPSQLDAELAAGARLVFFEYCISLIFVTLRRPTDIFLLRAGERGLAKGWPYTLLSLSLGWWGIPWGLLYTPQVLLTNLAGGTDVTEEVRAFLVAATGVGHGEARQT